MRLHVSTAIRTDASTIHNWMRAFVDVSEKCHMLKYTAIDYSSDLSKFVIHIGETDSTSLVVRYSYVNFQTDLISRLERKIAVISRRTNRSFDITVNETLFPAQIFYASNLAKYVKTRCERSRRAYRRLSARYIVKQAVHAR